MAYPILFLTASLLISMSWVAHCFLPDHNLPVHAPSPSNNDRLANVTIPGVLRCAVPPGNRPRHKPLVAGVNVVLYCDGDSTVVADAVTDTQGYFEFVVNSASTILFGGSNIAEECRIRLRLPIGGCSVSFPKGVINDPLGAVQPIINKLLGNDNNVVSNGNDHVVYTSQPSYYQSIVHDEPVVYTRDSSSYNDHSTMQDNTHA